MFEYSIEYLNDSNVWTTLKHWIRPIINKNTLDETHDETQVFLSCSPLDTPFKPFTRFVINITEKNESGVVVDVDTLYRVVVADEITQKTFGAKKLYDHDIRLAEASKELERYTVDNLSFTNDWNKAFQVSYGGANNIGNIYGEGWYNTDAIYIYDTNSGLFYYPNRFTNYNANDAYRDPQTSINRRPSIENTLILKTLLSYNTSADYRFTREVPTSIIQGNSLVVPNCDITPISNLHLANKTTSSLIFWKHYIDVYAEFNTEISNIVLQYPNGTITQVNANDQITLNVVDGRYRLRYTIKRSVRLHYNERDTLSGLDTNNYSSWFSGLETTLEFEVLCVESGTATTKLSIYDILNKLVNTTPTRFITDNNVRYQLFNNGTDQSVQYRYASVEAPEMIFTNKNLWEALKEIGGVVNAIPYLHVLDKNNWDIIDYMPLSSEENVADTVEEEFCNSESYYDSENYTASYDLTVDNMINPISSESGYIHEAGFYISKSLRSEEVEISETSMDIETVYPIYKINSLKYINYTMAEPEHELINNVKEIALYNALVSNTVDSGKAVNLYYTQGKKNIYGLQYKVSKNQYANAVNKVTIRELLYTITGQVLTTNELLQGKFIITYVPYLNARIKIFKPNSPKLNIDTSMFQNQSANVLDAKALGRKMVANIGRVGNLGYVDSIKTYHLNEVPLKGQRSSDNYYVSTVTTEYDRNHLLSSVQYTKDYQKISDWVNISNLQRYYEISEKQSVHRYINTNMFYIFGTPVAEIQKENGLNNKTGYPTTNYLANLFSDQIVNRKINASVLTAYSENNGSEFVCSRVYLNSNALAIGNNISIITDYQDNYGAGDQAVEYTQSDTQAFMNRAVPYSDDTGKIKSILIENVTDSNIIYPTNSGGSSGGVPGADEPGGGIDTPVDNHNSTILEANMNRLAKSLPAITALDDTTRYPTGSDYITIANSYQRDNMPTLSKIGCSQRINVLKDSREILHFNQQHHFVVNDESVVIGNAMTENCKFIQTLSRPCKLVFLKNRIDAYEFKIKDSDIISLTLPEEENLTTITQLLISMGNYIDSGEIIYNINDILSTLGHTDPLYIQPSLQYNGYIVGLNEDAQAWAIVTADIIDPVTGNVTVKGNDLVIGKNEFINHNYLENENINASRIYLSITSEY